MIIKPLTHPEALELKKEFPEEIIYNDTKMKVYVVPFNDEEFKPFMEHFRGTKIDDKTAKLFSRTNQYTVHALSRVGTWGLYLQLHRLEEYRITPMTP